MRRFVVGYVATLVAMFVFGWIFNQSVAGGWGGAESIPMWQRSLGLIAWLLFSSGAAYIILPVVGGALWAWSSQSKSGRFSGVVRHEGTSAEGRGCQIFHRVSIGGVSVGTAVVPDALAEQWRYPGVSVSGLGNLEVLKIGRCIVALNSERGFRSAWGLGGIHKAFPFLAMGFFLVTIVTMGAGALVTYLPVYLLGAAKVLAFKGERQATKPSMASR